MCKFLKIGCKLKNPRRTTKKWFICFLICTRSTSNCDRLYWRRDPRLQLNDLSPLHPCVAQLKQEISSSTNVLSYLQLFSSENLFSLIDIVLAAAGRAFTRITVERSFKETGLVPFSPSKIKKLAKKNHPQVADLEREQHLREHEKLVEDTTWSIEKVFQACQKESEKKAKQVQKVKATIKKN